MNKLKLLFAKYDFPFWVTAVADQVRSRVSSLFCSTMLRLYLFIAGCPVGSALKADGWVSVRARRRGSITIGNFVAINSRFGSNWAGLNHRTVWHVLDEGRIEIGDHSGMSGVILSSRSVIRLGCHVMLGAGVRIYDHDFHPFDPVARRGEGPDAMKIPTAPVELGDDVFVGAGAMILKGVSIGNRSIVGAGSVVRKGIYPPDSLIMGNPAMVVEIKTKSGKQKEES